MLCKISGKVLCVYNTLRSTAVLPSLHMLLLSPLSFYLVIWETVFSTPLCPESRMREGGAPGNGRGVRTAESLMSWHTLPECCSGTKQDLVHWWWLLQGVLPASIWPNKQFSFLVGFQKSDSHKILKNTVKKSRNYALDADVCRVWTCVCRVTNICLVSLSIFLLTSNM